MALLQASALLELQKRFVKQQQELQAATAVAAGSNTSEGVQVEPYFPQEKLQQELATLRQVLTENSNDNDCPAFHIPSGPSRAVIHAVATKASAPGCQV